MAGNYFFEEMLPAPQLPGNHQHCQIHMICQRAASRSYLILSMSVSL